MKINDLVTTLNKAAALLGSKGGLANGPNKARSAQLKSWWQSATPAERKIRIDRMAKGREKAKVKSCSVST